MRLLLSFLFMSLLAFSACKSDSNNSSTDTENSKLENGTSSTEDPSTLDINDIDVDVSEEVEIDVSMDKAIEDEKLAKKIIIESKKKEVDEIAKVEDKNETTLVGKSEEQKKKEAEMKLAATKKMIENSVNKGKTCEEILKEQDAFIDEFEKSKDTKIILKMAKAKNDPFFKECLAADEFAAKIEAQTVRLEQIMDQD